MKLTHVVLGFILGICSLGSYAQNSPAEFRDQTFRESLKSVILHPIQQEQALPVLTLNSSQKLLFSFDDLDGGFKTYKYSIEHCTSDWKTSGLNTALYLDGFREEILNQYSYSNGTYQKYTHYELEFPTLSMRPKLSGNYILKVFDDKNQLVITRRFYVVENLATIQAKVEQSLTINKRNTHQKLNPILGLNRAVQNPSMELQLVIMQNRNPLTAQSANRPNLIQGNQFLYNGQNQFEFSGSNEFRKFDIRSLRAYGAQVKNIQVNQGFKVELFPDLISNNQKYSSQFDENGSFFIRNSDGMQPAIDADYAEVSFTFKSNSKLSGKLYVVGAFNNYLINSQSEMTFQEANQNYSSSFKLKQGLYDYKYVILDAQDHLNLDLVDGSFYETKNSYQLFVYYKKQGARYHELWAVQELNN